VASNRILAVDDIYLEKSIQIYPVPAENAMTVYCGNKILKSYEITDLLGRIVAFEKNCESNVQVIHVGQLTPNVYFITLHFDNEISVVKKIVKK